MPSNKSSEDPVHFSFKRKKSWDDDGVAATVGTILSIMVFMTFLGMFTNQYVPIWMKENESNHMNNVVGQLSNLKSGIDMQVLNNNEQVASAPIYAPIQLHAEGVPVFASPTMGVLIFISDGPVDATGSPFFNLSYNYSVGSGASTQYFTLDKSNGGHSGGNLEFYGPNRYYVQQKVAFENGAIILNQSDGEAVLAGFAIRVVNNGGDIDLKFTLTSLTGASKTVGGSGTKSITSTLEYTSYEKLTNSSGGTVNLTICSKHADAWKTYFTALKTNFESGSSALPANYQWYVHESALISSTEYSMIYVEIKGVDTLEYTKAAATISMADIGV